MPFCEVSSTYDHHHQKGEEDHETKGSSNGIKIFYETYGRGFTKVLLIIGLAGTHESWMPQIKGLVGSTCPNKHDDDNIGYCYPADQIDPESNNNGSEEESISVEEDGIQVCGFDNRGMGRSSVPKNKFDYSTLIMAKDALALLDHLGWRKAHIFGHSMGAMIASKLAAIAPERVSSLALLNISAGGFQGVPKVDRRFISIALRFFRARTPEQRAEVDLDVHYTKEYLDECVGTNTRRTILYQEYVKSIAATGLQSNYGFEGQAHACWNHKLTAEDVNSIRKSSFPVSIIHGRHDIVAQVYYARKLAERMYPAARMVEMHGAHLVSHEKPDEVNQALKDLIQASESKLDALEWTNLRKAHSSKIDPKGEEIMITVSWIKKTRGYCSIYSLNVILKIHLCLLYLVGLFVTLMQHGKNIIKNLKPVRISPSVS